MAHVLRHLDSQLAELNATVTREPTTDGSAVLIDIPGIREIISISISDNFMEKASSSQPVWSEIRVAEQLHELAFQTNPDELQSARRSFEAEMEGELSRPQRERMQAIGDVAILAAQLERTKRLLDEAVIAARDAGSSWTHIGLAVGIAQQTAMRRWDAHAKKYHADYQRSRYGSSPDEAPKPEA
jgi:hypothetical protein